MTIFYVKLSSIFAGGVSGGDKELYSPYNCVGEKHIVLFRSLISTFVGAFKTRTLSQELSLLGVVGSGSLYSVTEQCTLERERGCPNECQWCRDACKHLPLRDHGLFRCGELCLDDDTRDGILVGRKGGPNAIFMIKAITVIEMISDCVSWHNLDHSIKDDRKLHKKLIDMGLETLDEDRADPQYIRSDDLEEVDKLVESLHIRPRDIPRDFFYKKMGIGTDGREWDIFCKSTVDNLIARGYAIDPKDLIVVDETKEPALRRII